MGSLDSLRLEATITTTQEAEAVCEMIRHLTTGFSSHREMVRGDIYPAEPEPTFHERLCQALGDPALLRP